MTTTYHSKRLANSPLELTASPVFAAAEQYLLVGALAAFRSRKVFLVAAAIAPNGICGGEARRSSAVGRWADDVLRAVGGSYPSTALRP
jgi:hypothetical protein